MKKKVVIFTVTGMVLLGGALGVGAMSNNDDASSKVEVKKENRISFEKAKEIAINKVEGSRLDSIELEYDDGVLIYDIEVDRHDEDDIEIKIDAKTGEVLKLEDYRDDDDNDDDNENKSVGKSKISQEEAVAIATKDTPGNVTEVEYDDGHYEIEIKKNGTEVEFKIDSTSGAIIEKDFDDDDDE